MIEQWFLTFFGPDLGVFAMMTLCGIFIFLVCGALGLLVGNFLP